MVTPSVQDTFSRVSIALGSPYMQIRRVELGALAGQLPEFTTHWRSFTSWPQSMDATIEARNPGPTSVFPLRSYGGDSTVDAAGSYTADYPTLRDLAVRVDGDGVPLRDFNGSTLMLEVPEHLVEVQASRGVLAGSVPHLGSRYVFPEAGQSTRALHPLMSWWMVLYAFSILARYHPKEWTETLQLTTSKVASQVEFLLDGAVSLIPEMIARQLSAADA